MRNRIYGRQLNRDTQHRTAMYRNLAAGLFEHGEIETTMAKARAVQPFVEKIITMAKRGTFSARRQVEAKLNDRKIHGWVADPNVPDSSKDNRYFELPDEGDIEFNRYGELRKAPRLVQHIMTKIAPMFEDRDGGYTRIVKTGRHRLGDATEIVLLQLVGFEEGPEIGGGTSGRRAQANKRAAFAAKLRKGGSEEAAAATAVAEPEEETAEQTAPEAEAAGTPEAEAPEAAEPETTDETSSEEDEKKE
jgi:large subunit ribosomal protein L17